MKTNSNKFRTNTVTVSYTGDSLQYMLLTSKKRIVALSVGPSPGIAVVMFSDKSQLMFLAEKFGITVWSDAKVEYLPNAVARQTGFVV